MVTMYIILLTLSLAYILYRWNTQTLKEGTIDYEDLDIEYSNSTDKIKHLLLSISYFLVGFSVTGVALYFVSGGLVISLVGAIIGGWILGCLLELGETYLLNT